MESALLLEKAIALASGAHVGITDRYEQPYILHLVRVMQRVHTVDEKIIAMLHDIVEDTDWTLDMLKQEGFPGHIVTAVDYLTRRDEQTYEEYIQRLKTDPLAIKVKLSDLTDNMDIRRIPVLKAEDFDRLNKYLKAWHELKDLLS